MPNLKASIKSNRQTITRTAENSRMKNRYRKVIKEFSVLVSEGNLEAAKAKLPRVYKLLDKATKRGILKPNTSSRKKSQLAKQVN